MLSLKTHNILDYVIGAALIISPYLFGFSNIIVAKNLFLTLGFGLIAYSLLTKYRYALVPVIPLGVHMMFDVIAGLVVMTAPWMFGYQFALTGFQLAVHFVFGLGAVALVAFTRSKTSATLEARREEGLKKVA